MATNKIGFHIGSQPRATDYGPYIRTLDAAGIPAVCMSTGGEGLGDILAQWDSGSTVPHVAVVRYMPTDGNQDVPRYELAPTQAAVSWWSWYKPRIGPDVQRHKDKIVLKCGNELDKNQAEWLAAFYLELYDIMQGDPDGPYRLAAFGFASGEPEPEHWRGPNMRQYLQLCADDPIGAAICLHEYSYADDLISSYPFLIGRFLSLFAECDDMGVKRPSVYIHEWGWRQDTIPPDAMQQLPFAAELYSRYPEVKGAGLWTLQGAGTYGNPHISTLVQPLIKPMTEYSLTASFPDPPPTPPPNGGSNMTKTWLQKLTSIRPFPTRGAATHLHVVFSKPDGNGGEAWVSTTQVPIPASADRVRIHEYAHTEEPPPNPNPPPPVLTLPAGSIGVDVSYWQGPYNWTDEQFGIIRVSDGMTANSTTHDENGIDRQFWNNANKLTALGIPWSIYHFLRPGSIQAQAEKVGAALSALEALGQSPRTAFFENNVKLPDVFIDVEDSTLTSAQVQAFYDELKKVYRVGIYTGKSVWEQITAGAAVWWASVPLWIAAYGANDGNIPGWPNGPNLPRGWGSAILWQYTSIPLDKNVCGPFPPVSNPPTPPTGQAYNMTQYYLPPNGRTYGDISIKSTNWGQGDVRQQLQLHGGYLFVTKGNEFEKRMILDGVIYFMLDDSPGDGKYYTVNSPDGWIPASWSVGQTFTRQETATFYYKSNCQPTGEILDKTTTMLFKAHYPEWTSPHGIKLANVAHLQWLLNGNVEEDYYLAPGLGYAGWKNAAGRESWIKELIPYTDQQPNKFAGSCYHAAFG